MLVHLPAVLSLALASAWKGPLKIALGGLGAPLITQKSITPASLAVAQYIAALPEVALLSRNVLCEDEVCAMAAAAASGKVNRTWLNQFDMSDLDAPLPMVGQTKPAYGTAVGVANLIVLVDILADDEIARCMAVRVAEAVKLGAWVIVGDAASASRQTFLDVLEVELRYVDCGHPKFDEACIVQQPLLGWSSEPVQLLRLNSPGFAPALDTGYMSLEERRGFELPSPVVEILEPQNL